MIPELCPRPLTVELLSAHSDAWLRCLRSCSEFHVPRAFCIGSQGGGARNLHFTSLPEIPTQPDQQAWVADSPAAPPKGEDSGGGSSVPQKPKSPTGEGTSERQCPLFLPCPSSWPHIPYVFHLDTQRPLPFKHKSAVRTQIWRLSDQHSLCIQIFP